MAESSRSTSESLSRALVLARDALSHEPAGLLTDFDGTLSPIVADPSLARLVDGASGALADLVRRLAVVAVITGRAALDARRLTSVPGLLVAGNHGVEWLDPDADAPLPSPAADRVRQRIRAMLDHLPPIEGTSVEDKGLSATLHYRNSPDPDAARDSLLSGLGTLEAGLELRHGLMSIELRATSLGDKGEAARAVVDRFGLRGVLVMGDDTTDLDMFAAVAGLRDRGSLHGAIVGVGGPDREVPEAVAAAADVVLADPAAAALLLAGIVS